MKRLFTFLLTLLPFSLWAMDMPPQPKINQEEYSNEAVPFTEIAPGVYAGQTKVGNEIVYFGMERLDEENVQGWRIYQSHTQNLTNNRGIFWGLSAASKRGIRQPFENIQSRTGFINEEEYFTFMNEVDEAISKNPNIPNAIAGIPSGTAGFNTRADGNGYVVYASRVPVQGRFPFPKDLPEFITLKQYLNYYGSIIMSVGSTDYTSLDRYENRGIFKNPMSFILDGNKYPSLSLKLHGFSALVASHIFKNKQYMIVSPVPSMIRILLGVKEWQRGDVLIDDKDLMDYTPDELEIVKGGIGISGQGEPRFLIKIEALIKFYKGE